MGHLGIVSSSQHFMAYTSMDRLKDIEELVRKVDKSIIPDEFNNMYKQFKKALRLR